MKTNGYAITLTIGLTLVVIALWDIGVTLVFIKSGQRTTAITVGLEPTGTNPDRTYYPIFKFKAFTNQEIFFRDNVSTSRPKWKKVQVVYDPDDPKKVKVLSYYGAFRLAVFLLALGIPLIIVGGGYFVAKNLLKI